MKPVLFVLLLATAAHADPAAKCPVKGAPIFEIDRRDTNAPKWQQTAKLYESGAWTFEQTDADGKAGTPDAGCLAPDATKAVKTQLAAAPWKVTTNRIHCMAFSPRFTIYKAGDKPAFEQHLCGQQSIDEATHKTFQDIEKQLGPAQPTTQP